MHSDVRDTVVAQRSIGAVPRAVWVGVGVLSLVTAALAGVLVTRSVEPSSAVTATATPSAAVPRTTELTSTPTPTAPSPSGKTERHAKTVTPSGAVVTQPSWSAPSTTTRAVLCTDCGVVESVNQVQHKGQGTGLGAVAGGVLGGVVGHQVGGGNGKTAMTVLGAIGGGLAGNEVEKHARAETLFDVRVRMEDGTTRTFQRAQALAVGTHVVAEGTSLHVARDTQGRDEPRSLQTSAPSGSRS